MATPDDEARDFLRTAHLYQLGELVTEARHPLTRHLSEWARTDLPRAYMALTAADVRALALLGGAAPAIVALRASIQAALADGGRVFLCGCGATGRLSLLLESLWHGAHDDDSRVRGFMAGGDVALVHSLEGFEDFPEYGERHLRELGFTPPDLLIACTEGGETPYVIGAVEYAASLARRPPYFLYCNPDADLAPVTRSRRILERTDVRKINLTVGPMALSGSTRMQASTVLQLAVGYALLTDYDTGEITSSLGRLSDMLMAHAATLLRPFTERESAIYGSGEFVRYEAEADSITVFTDTTERAPTFSLTPFANRLADATRERPPSLSYVILPQAATAQDAWIGLLGRAPHALDWPDVDARTERPYLEAFDFSVSGRAFRDWQLQGAPEHRFRVFGPGIGFELTGEDRTIALEGDWHALERHTLLKMLLNQHSTLVMGRLGRYESNIMTWVSPTNGKLVDRAARYARHLLADRGVDRSYEDVVIELFRQRGAAETNESVVMKVVKHWTE